MTDVRAAARKNGAFGYKAVVIYPNRTYQPVTKNFKTADEAKEYAQKYIDANNAPKPTPEEAQAKRNARMDKFIEANREWIGGLPK